MSMLKKILSWFGKSNKQDEISQLNNSCNILFEQVFNKCRQEFGSELIDIMNIKKRIIEAKHSAGTDVRELLSKKILTLIITYLELANTYVNSINSLKNLNDCDSQITDIAKANREKLTGMYSLIKSLNLQMNLNSIEAVMADEFQDIINEAVALNNVMEEKVKKKIR